MRDVDDGRWPQRVVGRDEEVSIPATEHIDDGGRLRGRHSEFIDQPLELERPPDRLGLCRLVGSARKIRWAISRCRASESESYD